MSNEFECSVCGKKFSLPQATLDRYPNWTPRYCRDHSPKKANAAAPGSAKKVTRSSSSGAGELNLTLLEVLERFKEGPQTGIFTDGSARPNPGPGGWWMVWVKDGQVLAQHYGNEKDTTNNRMELTALITAYKLIPKDEQVDIFTDSDLCVKSITIWAPGWAKRGWKRKDGPIKNVELIKELYALHCDRPGAKLQWIEAHNGWLWNEYADSLATAWAREAL